MEELQEKFKRLACLVEFLRECGRAPRLFIEQLNCREASIVIYNCNKTLMEECTITDQFTTCVPQSLAVLPPLFWGMLI